MVALPLLMALWAAIIRLGVQSQYLIALQPNETATIFCYSSSDTTIIYNRTCETEVANPNKILYDPDRSCVTTVGYKDVPTSVQCVNKERRSLNLSLLLVPRPGFTNISASAVSFANERTYWCMKPVKERQVNAGHLLSASFSGLKDGQFYTVELEDTWNMQRGQSFTCNNTNYTLETVYKCFEFVPTGWPTFTNCTIVHKIGITIAVICAFILAYLIVCVGLNSLLNWMFCRSKSSYVT